jgi:hypothetical protein
MPPAVEPDAPLRKLANITAEIAFFAMGDAMDAATQELPESTHSRGERFVRAIALVVLGLAIILIIVIT